MQATPAGNTSNGNNTTLGNRMATDRIRQDVRISQESSIVPRRMIQTVISFEKADQNPHSLASSIHKKIASRSKKSQKIGEFKFTPPNKG